MRCSDELNELFGALSVAQGEIESARKGSTNPHFGSRYADLASVRAAIREPLSRNGLAYMQLARTNGNKVVLETVLGHKSGQFIAETLEVPAVWTAQGVGSALAYARRYALMSITGVAPDDDDDGNAATQAEPETDQRLAYVEQAEERIERLLTPSGSRDWWLSQASVRAELFSGDADPLYRRLRSAYATKLRQLESACRVIADATGGALVAGQDIGALIDDRVPF
jgi:hypothetical protein